MSAGAVTGDQHRDLLSRQSWLFGNAAAFARRARQLALPFEALQQKDLVNLRDASKRLILRLVLRLQKTMAPLEGGVLVDFARLGGLAHRQRLIKRPGKAEVFYNREDLWQFPRRPAGFDGEEMEPYYINMRLPGETRTEFFLMLPMVPSKRQNMIAWLAARCDQPDYGKLIVYEFPKEKLVYGPFQIEARINQNTGISQQISLWNQMGSRVMRGNLLVVPIANSILYVSPLYLRAQSGQLPELKRVIAAYGERVVMEETLPAALAALFKQSASVAGLPAVAGSSPSGPADERARQALADYDRAIDRLKAGDWAGFGAELDALRPLLEGLSRPTTAH